MNTPHNPKPSDYFRRDQRKLRRLMESGAEIRRLSERMEREIKRRLISEFISAFGLTKDKRHRAERFFDERRPSIDIFDHVSYYQRNGCPFAVSQPYVIQEDDLQKWCPTFNGRYVIIDQWAHYFPGHAHCFFVEAPVQMPEMLFYQRKKYEELAT